MIKHFRFSVNTLHKLDEHGLSTSAVLRRAGLPQEYLTESRVLLSTEELFALWRAIGESSTDPAIGVLLGTETRPERFNTTGVAALSNHNFGAAVTQMARYKQLTCPEEIVQSKKGGEWCIRFHWLLADKPEPSVLIECAFAWMLSIGRVGTGTRLSPVRVELIEPRAHRKLLERHFGCEVICGAQRNAIIFRATDADIPFKTRNAELLAMLAPQFEKELQEQASDAEDFPDRVRLAIQQKLTGRRPTIDDIAGDLHISSRTLQRRLQDHGSSFQKVLEDARRQLARHYLNNSVLELNEAAYLLGYEDSNSFVRAFRTWEGVPPARWREQHRIAPV